MKLDKYWINQSLTSLLIVAFFIGITLFAYLFVQLITNHQNLIKDYSNLITAFFILLSASIAATSMLKSIEHNQALKIYEQASNNKGKIVFTIFICQQIGAKLDIIYRDKQSYSTLSNQKIIYQKNKDMQKINNLWEKISNEKYICFINSNDSNSFITIYSKIQALKGLSKVNILINNYFDGIEDTNCSIKTIISNLNSEKEKIEKIITNIHPEV